MTLPRLPLRRLIQGLAEDPYLLRHCPQCGITRWIPLQSASYASADSENFDTLHTHAPSKTGPITLNVETLGAKS